MDYCKWVSNIKEQAGIYSFDIMPDGSFSEIRLMGFNKDHEALMHDRPDTPEFYPGIPYRNYWSEINFERFIYESASKNKSLYSYVNAHGNWIKGFYIPIRKPGTDASEPEELNADGSKTVYVLYMVNFSPDVDGGSMAQNTSGVSKAITNISVRLHQTPNFIDAMTMTVSEITKVCGAERCSLYTVDVNNQECTFITQNGVQKDFLEKFTSEMGRTPFETAEAWEKLLAGSDCLILEDLSLIEERDPVWTKSLRDNNIHNIILFAVRYNRTLVGFIWAANFDVSKSFMIKDTLELTAFLIAAVIANHQLLSKLEVLSTVDGLTNVKNRNAMNKRVERLISGEDKLPEKMGIAYMDLNGLKTVNDEDGHVAGDKLLSKAASFLKIVFADYEIYRAGGDEFVIICPDITEKELEDQISVLRAMTESTENVSFAIGTACCSGKYDICQSMQTADERMYKDKEAYYRNHPDKDRRRRPR